MANKRKILRNGVLIGVGLAGLVGLIITSTKKIEPLCWYDFNGDGVQDAIIIEKSYMGENEKGELIPWDELLILDGNSIYTEAEQVIKNDAIQTDIIGEGLYFRTKTEYFCRRPLLSIRSLDIPMIRRYSQFPVTAVRLRDLDGNGKLDLEVYTQIDVEPTARRDVFYDVE